MNPWYLIFSNQQATKYLSTWRYFVESIPSCQSHPVIKHNRATSAQWSTNYSHREQRSKENSNLASPNLNDLSSQVVLPQVCKGESPNSTIRGQSSLDANTACIIIAFHSASARDGAVDQQTPPQLITLHCNSTPRFDEDLFSPSNYQSRSENLMVLPNSQANIWLQQDASYLLG